MRDRDRPAGANLLLKHGYDAADGAENVSEADGDEPRGRELRECVNVAFGELLRHAHHAGRVDRLIRGNEHEALKLKLVRQIGDELSSQRIVLDGFARVGFHHRHVLVRSRMEQDLGSELLEKKAHPRFVGHVADERDDDRRAAAAFEFAIDLKQVVFGPLDENQRAGFV